MLLADIFETYKYINILQTDCEKEYRFSMESFLDEDGKKPQELKAVYMSCNKDEIFIILDGRNQNIKTLSEDWDCRISFFINHCFENSKDRDKLQFNLVQIILYEEDSAETDKSIETMLFTSRKIMVKGHFEEEMTVDGGQEEIIDIDDMEKYVFPFVLVAQDAMEWNMEEKKQLEQLLPKGTEFEFLNRAIPKKRNDAKKSVMSLSDVQYKTIEEWINLQ